eukprot:Platyproteum_vivax@DN14058_c0_g1_i1.p1
MNVRRVPELMRELSERYAGTSDRSLESKNKKRSNRLRPVSQPICSNDVPNNRRRGSQDRHSFKKSQRNSIAVLKQLFKELAVHSNSADQTVDKDTFLKYFPMPGVLGERLFAVFDRDSSNTIDFQEFFTGMALIYNGTLDEKRKLLFDMYDLDGNGVITREELSMMLKHIPAAFKILQTCQAQQLHNYAGRTKSVRRELNRKLISANSLSFFVNDSLIKQKNLTLVVSSICI